MLNILIVSFVCSVLLLMLLTGICNIQMIKKKIPLDKRYSYIKKRTFIYIIICAVFMLMINRFIPSVMWTKGEKESKTVNKVADREDIYPLPQIEGTYYMGRTKVKGKDKYAINIFIKNSIQVQLLDPSLTDIVYFESGDKPRYEEINIYKTVRLKKQDWLSKSVNDFYGYISGWQESKTAERYKIYIPKDTVKDDYLQK